MSAVRPAFTLDRRALLAGLAATPLATRVSWAQAPLNVVATTGMIADTASAIAGDRASVRALMGAGVDPHAYRQTRTDIAALVRADLTLWNGLFLEAQMEEFLADLSDRAPVVAVAEALPRDALMAHEDYEGRFDPHVWMDPTLWRGVARRIEAALAEVDGGGAADFGVNADAYVAELDALHAYASQILETVPTERRVLVTAHDAFNYFGAAYDFEVVGIQGISTNSEAGVQRIEEVVDLLVSRGIGAVFVETSVADRNMRALAEGAAARGHEVTIGGSLFSDAMGEPGTYEGTYLGMMDHNVTTIARALGGRAPEGGRLGRLSEAT